jgi:hypothetical protein
MKFNDQVSERLALAAAAVIGLGITAADLATPFGDDTSQFTVFLWLLASGLIGFALPVRPWRWAAVLGPILPIAYLVMKLAGCLPPDDRNGYLSYFILLPFSLAICLLGTYAGAAARRFVSHRRPHSRPTSPS